MSPQSNATTVSEDSTPEREAELTALIERCNIFDAYWSSLSARPDYPALLYRLSDGLQTQFYELAEDATFVGRLSRDVDSENGSDLVFADAAKMGRRHFVIRNVDGRYVLEHLSKVNKTYINTNESSVTQRTLVAGDVIMAGGVIMVFTGD